jgi:predicted  nucleic acid-binding Zn-ribbon protein
MQETIQQLLVLQDRDRRISQLKLEHGRIPEETAAVERRVKEEVARLEKTRNDLKHLESERKKLEIDAESKRAQVTKYRGQLAAIKSNTEYQALLKEISKAESDIKLVEDHELEFMEQFERLQPELKQGQVALKELTAKAESDKADLQRRGTVIAEELSNLRSEREKLASQIDADVLGRYQRLMRSKGDVAIVPIQHGNCGGCHLHLPPQKVHDARSAAGLTSCDYCGRILYWQPE